MFGPDDLVCLVGCAAQALEGEDRYLRACAERRGWRQKPGLSGLRSNTNERYYQFVIWRALIGCTDFPWCTETENELYDLVFCDAKNKPAAYAELKGWWSGSGKPEIPGILRDMEVKLATRSVPGAMLILTSHAAAKAKDNFRWLAGELRLNREELTISSFATDPGFEFAVIGFIVRKVAAPSEPSADPTWTATDGLN